jgi:hypothetical protein
MKTYKVTLKGGESVTVKAVDITENGNAYFFYDSEGTMVATFPLASVLAVVAEWIRLSASTRLICSFSPPLNRRCGKGFLLTPNRSDLLYTFASFIFIIILCVIVASLPKM